MKRVLLVAYHFPPVTGSSGVQRALRFSTHLPEFGWQPVVLTAHPRAYEQHNDDLLKQVRDDVPVIRAPAWNTSKHFAIRGRYPPFLARPDRWHWWWYGAVPAGLAAIRKHKVQAIWSTYPIATAHSIGVTLARLTGLPLIADFRDPMAQDGYPEDPATWRSFSRIERKTIATAKLSTFTTLGAVRLYEQRFPQYRDRLRLLENGYDEDTFHAVASNEPLNPGRLTLLHSGVVYPAERDPTRLFEALSNLRANRPALFDKLIIRFRAPLHDDLLRKLAAQYDVAANVEILPNVNYRDAAAEMCRADGLLLLQGNNCNAQIPAKFYEYLRARRPMVVLADPVGDTGTAALSAGVEAVVALEDSSGINELLERFAAFPDSRSLPPESAVSGASRRARTGELARMLDELETPK